MLPDRITATLLLERHVTDPYQRLHARMVATALEGYADHFNTTDVLKSDPGLPHLADSAPAHDPALRPATPANREDRELWYATGLLHDLDFESHPDTHPATSLGWFKEWGYPDALLHAIEAHAYGYHGFRTLPRTRLAAALLATDELCGLFYAYRKMNPVRYGDMKASSLRKKFREPSFAAKIDRTTIELGCTHLGIPLEEHLQNLIRFLAPLP